MKNKKKRLIVFLIPLILVASYFVIDSILFDGFWGKEISERGIQATFFAKPEIKQQPAIVILGGGQGGDYWAKEFAGQGFVGLSLPYYRQAGLPPLMEDIPLEYFENTLNWLGEQAEVDPKKIIVMGASRHAELALLIASTFPDLVSGVIAFAPGSISWPNAVLPFNSDSLKPTWTYRNQDIPYLPMRKITGTDSPTIETLEYWMAGLQRVSQHPESIIPVEKIGGPILLLSGKDDKVWPSAFMSDMIEERLIEFDFSHDVQNIQFEDAGHLISRNLATISAGRLGQMQVGGKLYEFEYGGTIEGDKLAITQSWEKILSFVQQYEAK